MIVSPRRWAFGFPKRLCRVTVASTERGIFRSRNSLSQISEDVWDPGRQALNLWLPGCAEKWLRAVSVRCPELGRSMAGNAYPTIEPPALGSR